MEISLRNLKHIIFQIETPFYCLLFNYIKFSKSQIVLCITDLLYVVI